MSYSVDSSWANIGYESASMHVTAINLSSKQLQGTIASEIGRMYFLQVLNMASNAISLIPSTIGQLRLLTSIDLSSNKLAGTIPVEVEGVCAIALTVRFHCDYFQAPKPSFCMPSSASLCQSCPNPNRRFPESNPINGFYGQCGFCDVSDINPATIVAGVSTAITVFGSNFAPLNSDVYDIHCIVNSNEFMQPTSVDFDGNSLACVVTATLFSIQISVSNFGTNAMQSLNP
jgi:hypothetical protein